MNRDTTASIPHQTPPETGWNLRGFVQIYGRYWYFFAIAMLLALGTAYYLLWYSTPVYAITARVMLRDENAGTANLLRGLNMDVASRNIQNEMEILRSHNLLATTLSELDFEVTYHLLGNIKVSEMYTDCPFEVRPINLPFEAYFTEVLVDVEDAGQVAISYTDKSGAIYKAQGQLGVPIAFYTGALVLVARPGADMSVFNDPEYKKRNYKLQFNTLNRLQNHVHSRLRVGLARAESTMIELYMEDEVPQKGVDFLNKHLEVYLRSDVEFRNRSGSATEAFIDQQLEQLAQDLRTIEGNRELYKVQKGIIDLESESQMVLEGVRALDADLARLNARIGVIDQLEEYVYNNQQLGDIAPSVIDINDALLLRLVGKMSELQNERERLLTTSTENDPRLIPLKAEMDLTRSSLLENIRNIRKGLERSRRELSTELGRYQSRIEQIPRTERELLEIERQFKVRESLYLYLLEKKVEVAMGLAAANSDKRIIDQARVMPAPVRPSPRRTYSIAVLLGLLVPVLSIAVVSRWNNRLVHRDELLQHTGLPLLGYIAYHAAEPVVGIAGEPASGHAESYRALRTNLRFLLPATPPVLMVTSTMSSEGKTYTSCNLAAILALADKRVLLLGLDLRKPTLGKYLQLEENAGLSAVLAGQERWQDLVQPLPSCKGIDVLLSGPVPPNPAELVARPAMAALLEEARRAYDIVIMDTPPIGMVTDSLVLMEHADVVLYVVRQHITRKDDLDFIRQTASSHPQPSGLVFNAVKKGKKGYGYYGGNAYTYGYGQSGNKAAAHA